MGSGNLTDSSAGSVDGSGLSPEPVRESNAPRSDFSSGPWFDIAQLGQNRPAGRQVLTHSGHLERDQQRRVSV